MVDVGRVLFSLCSSLTVPRINSEQFGRVHLRPDPTAKGGGGNVLYVGPAILEEKAMLGGNVDDKYGTKTKAKGKVSAVHHCSSNQQK